MANNSTFVTSKKQSLLDYKSKLLYDIKNCEQEIDEARRLYNRNLQYKENGINKFDSDSDSDDAIYQKLVKTAETKNRSIEKDAFDNLQICLQATEELTDLHILHSDTSIMVEPPQLTEQYKHEEVEDGVWREVHADCKADFVPFSIAFYVHQPYRKHSPPSYHNVQVGIVKKNHEIELQQSILNEVQRPSDAIQIMRNYAVAHRCRRTTLAQLADKYGDGDLCMEVLSDGGYLLRCADVLDLSWRLENKWSPVARFYHQMKLNVESMDDHSIKIIKKAFMQLRQPTMKADERTFLLSKIIDICIQFRRDNNDSDHSNGIDDIVRSKSSSNRKYTSNEGERKRKKKYAEDITEEECVTKKSKPNGGQEITELVEEITKRYSDDRQTTKKNAENVISNNTLKSQQYNNESNRQQNKITENVEKINKAHSDDRPTALEKKTNKVISKKTQIYHEKNGEANSQQNKITENVEKRSKANSDDRPTTAENKSEINQGKNGEANSLNQKKKQGKTNTEKNRAANDKEQRNNKEPITKDQLRRNKDSNNDSALKEKSQDKLSKNKHSNNPNAKNTSPHNTKGANQPKNKQNAVTDNKDKQSKIAKTNKISRDNKENNVRTKIPQKISLHKKFDQNPLRTSPRKSPRKIAGTMMSVKKSVFTVKGKSDMAIKASNKLIKK